MADDGSHPSFAEVRRLVDGYMAAEGAGHWPERRAQKLLEAIEGRPSLSACIDAVERRLVHHTERPELALAVAMCTFAPAPVEQSVEPLWIAYEKVFDTNRGAEPYAARQDRLALDITVAESLRSVPWGAAWEGSRFALVIMFKAAARHMVEGGVTVALGPVPASPSMPHRSARLAASTVMGTCNCAGRKPRGLCQRAPEHLLAAWEPSSMALATFIDRAVAGPKGDGRFALTDAAA